MEIIRKRQRVNTDACECGRDLNQGGQELGPREQWGEETGESLSDILGIK